MLQTSKVKQKLKNGEIVIRAFLRSSDPTSAEIMALAGVDLIVIDNEHYPFNPQRMETIIRAAETYGAECMVRVPNTEPARIAQIMDMGAIGVVVPHIESREEALAVVDAVKYAPVGHRGFCPITRAASYGMAMSGDEYTRLANEQTCIILMTETKKGLEALDDILAIPEVDGISIGPSDVSASYGLPGQPDHPVVKAAIEEGQRKISASGKALVAQAYTPEAAERMRARGATVMTVGSDVQMIRWRLGAMMHDIRALERECFGGEGEQA